MGCALEDFPAIGTLALEHGAGIMQAVGEHMQGSVAPGRELTVIPDDAVEPVVRFLSHGASSSSFGRSFRTPDGSNVHMLLRRGPTPGMFRPDHESAFAPS